MNEYTEYAETANAEGAGLIAYIDGQWVTPESMRENEYPIENYADIRGV